MADRRRIQTECFQTGDPRHFVDPSDDCCGEFHTIRTMHCNALLEGRADAMVAFVALFAPDLRKPIAWMRPGALEFEPGCTGTVVLEAVSELDRGEQSKMFRWLDETGKRVQTICMTTTPLFPLVVRGRFNEALYYRLNSVLLRVRTNPLDPTVVASRDLPHRASRTELRTKRGFVRLSRLFLRHARVGGLFLLPRELALGRLSRIQTKGLGGGVSRLGIQFG